jgi:hypothetical protein
MFFATRARAGCLQWRPKRPSSRRIHVLATERTVFKLCVTGTGLTTVCPVAADRSFATANGVLAVVRALEAVIELGGTFANGWSAER